MSTINAIEQLLREFKIEYSGDTGEELAITSVQLVSLVVALEEEFNIEIPDEYLVFDVLNTYEKIDAMLKKVGACV